MQGNRPMTAHCIESTATCDNCHRTHAISMLAEGELRGKRHEGLTIPYDCPNCGTEVYEREIQ